jgi:DNA-binding MarR family transcriptional regulator
MEGEERLRLRYQVCFALYAASRAVTGLYRPILDELGITYPQYLVLLVLWERGETTVKELGDALMLDSGTLSPLLKRLEATGLVVRRRGTVDERSVVIGLTGEGDRLRRRALEVPTSVASATGLPPAELSALRDTLVALTEAVNNSREART